MSGHSKWSNIRRKKEASDAAKGAVFTKIAKDIAARVRHSSGGYAFIKALGVMLEERNIAQVSMNLKTLPSLPTFSPRRGVV